MYYVYWMVIGMLAVVHAYQCISQGTSFLTWEFLLLLFSPFAKFIWLDVASLKLGKDGLELERIKKDVNQAIKLAAHGEKIDPEALELIFKSVEANEWATLILSRMLLRKGLMLLAPKDHGLGNSPSLSKLIKLCADTEAISTVEAELYEKLRDITFYAEWWSGRPPSYEDWNWALENSKPILGSLFRKQSMA